MGQDDQSVGRRCSLCQPFHFLPCCLSAPLTHLSASFSGTLELKATKDSAHSREINSVAFSPDGKMIVSGSDDKTIKVWDAGQPFHLSPCHLSLPLMRLSPPFSGTLELKATKDSAHSSAIASVAFSPDGKTIVSGSYDQTIKVWDAGQPFHLLPHHLSPPRTPFLLASQILWNSRQPKRAPITARSCPSPSLRTARRSSLDLMTRRSKCGPQVLAFANCHAASLLL